MPLDEDIADHLNEGRLKLELLKMDIELRRKQDIWEHPRNIAILVGVVAAIAGALGFKIGQTPSPPPVIINLPPQPTK